MLKKRAVTAAAGDSRQPVPDPTRDNQENELEAEQESAAAMDSDVPQPPGADATTEGQPT